MEFFYIRVRVYFPHFILKLRLEYFIQGQRNSNMICRGYIKFKIITCEILLDYLYIKNFNIYFYDFCWNIYIDSETKSKCNKQNETEGVISSSISFFWQYMCSRLIGREANSHQIDLFLFHRHILRKVVSCRQ